MDENQSKQFKVFLRESNWRPIKSKKNKNPLGVLEESVRKSVVDAGGACWYVDFFNPLKEHLHELVKDGKEFLTKCYQSEREVDERATKLLDYFLKPHLEWYERRVFDELEKFHKRNSSLSREDAARTFVHQKHNLYVHEYIDKKSWRILVNLRQQPPSSFSLRMVRNILLDHLGIGKIDFLGFTSPYERGEAGFTREDYEHLLEHLAASTSQHYGGGDYYTQSCVFKKIISKSPVAYTHIENALRLIQPFISSVEESRYVRVNLRFPIEQNERT